VAGDRSSRGRALIALIAAIVMATLIATAWTVVRGDS
jgi:hypothetical protein